MKVKLQENDFTKKLEQEIERIKEKASSIGKITLFGNNAGELNKATVEYKDAIGNTVKEVIKLNDKVKITQTYTENLAKDENAILKIKEEQYKQSVKNADEMEKAALEAEKFIAKSKNMVQNASVSAAVNKAEEIKVAVGEGDVEKVRKLNDEFAVLKASLQTGRTGLDSWSQGMQNAIKQTIEYATSIGIVYGAMRQIKEGVQYLTELNKEMTNIQVLS